MIVTICDNSPRVRSNNTLLKSLQGKSSAICGAFGSHHSSHQSVLHSSSIFHHFVSHWVSHSDHFVSHSSPSTHHSDSSHHSVFSLISHLFVSEISPAFSISFSSLSISMSVSQSDHSDSHSGSVFSTHLVPFAPEISHCSLSVSVLVFSSTKSSDSSESSEISSKLISFSIFSDNSQFVSSPSSISHSPSSSTTICLINFTSHRSEISPSSHSISSSFKSADEWVVFNDVLSPTLSAAILRHIGKKCNSSANPATHHRIIFNFLSCFGFLCNVMILVFTFFVNVTAYKIFQLLL